MKLNKMIAWIVIIVIALSLFGGCGSKDSSTEAATTTSDTEKSAEQSTAEAAADKKLEGKITFATNRTDLADTTLRELADAFQKENPGVQVEIEALKDPGTVLQTRAAANELPDVTPVIHNIKSDLPLFYAPLDDLGFSKDDFYFYDMGTGEDGKLYRITNTVIFDCITYSKVAFKNAGIDSAPKTLDEFYAACEKLKGAGIIPVATNFKDKWPLYFYAHTFAEINSGNINYERDLAQKDQILSDDKGILTGLQILTNLKNKGYTEPDLVSTNWDGFKRDMAVGKVGMTFLGSWIAQQVMDNGAKAEDLGCFPFPFPDNQGVRVSPDWYFGVAKNSENMDAAKAFMKYLFEDGRLAVSTKVYPSNKKVKADDPFINELLSYGVPAIEAVDAGNDYNNLLTKSQIDLSTVAQEYVTAKDPDAIVKKYNDKWAEARKALAK